MDASVMIDRFGPMPAPRAVHMLLQVCDSLGEAHASGLVHRDIKPSNVFVARYGRAFDFVKVLDFGLVKQRHAAGTQLTMASVVTGTPAFMSPEQVTAEDAADQRSDIYALGCVAFWLLTGRYVFEGASQIEIMLAHVNTPPVAPSERTELPIPPELDRLVLACLEKDPSLRPPTADALAEALRPMAARHPWTAEQAGDWWRVNRPAEAAGAAVTPPSADRTRTGSTQTSHAHAP
jgi:serine/threonine-protein kinase